MANVTMKGLQDIIDQYFVPDPTIHFHLTLETEGGILTTFTYHMGHSSLNFFLESGTNLQTVIHSLTGIMGRRYLYQYSSYRLANVEIEIKEKMKDEEMGHWDIWNKMRKEKNV